MRPTRRRMMIAMTGVIAAAFAPRPARSFAEGVGQVGGTPQPMPSPNAPRNQNVPAGLDGSEIPVKGDGQTITPANWMEIKSDADKLLQMATDFKTQVDHTNLSSTLPVQLLDDAHKIEKLAKHIQDKMKR